jgi:hypothetical protein
VIATARRPETLADLPVDQRLRLDVTVQESVDQEEVAVAVADTIGEPQPPLRAPVGTPARRVLQACQEAPESEPFLMAAIDW